MDTLHIRNATLDILNVSLPVWQPLKLMSVTNGRINGVVGEFRTNASVSCLNLSSNGINNFEDRSLVNLDRLQQLDLSNNNISDMPRFKEKGHVKLDISSK